jgi:hypothetical protein
MVMFRFLTEGPPTPATIDHIVDHVVDHVVLPLLRREGVACARRRSQVGIPGHRTPADIVLRAKGEPSCWSRLTRIGHRRRGRRGRRVRRGSGRGCRWALTPR